MDNLKNLEFDPDEKADNDYSSSACIYLFNCQNPIMGSFFNNHVTTFKCHDPTYTKVRTPCWGHTP